MTYSLRQGDVLISSYADEFPKQGRLEHLTLAEGEVTGHSHRISEGEGTLYLKVLSEKAVLTHEEHKPIEIPNGNWLIRIQREYEPEGWRYVVD